MVTVAVTPEEIRSGKLDDAHREQAVRAVLEDGFVVLGDLVSREHIDILDRKLVEDLEALRRRKDAPYNWNAGNVQQDPPPFPPYLFADVLLNEMVIAVTSAILGPGLKNTMYSGNNAVTSESRQPVHADLTHLWPRMKVAHPPAQLVVNIPTVDVSAENGSTEIWPGTHLDVTAVAGRDIKIPADALERQRAIRPPIQPVMHRGSVLIRDGRMWHAGMPNRTSRPRPMIAMIHTCGWLEAGEPLVFPEGSRDFFRHPILRTHARFVAGPIDHISTPKAYEYEGAAKGGR